MRHALLGLPGTRIDGIRTVYSHEQGFLQCAGYLEAHGDMQRVPCFNTAVAARRVQEEGNPANAAIASPLAGETYGLAVLQEEIQSFEGNTTRFIVIGRERAAQGRKAMLTFTLRHERGALHRALACFVALGANLTRIESRPIPGTPFEYRFYVDVEGQLSAQRLEVLLEVLSEDCKSCALLGVFDPAEGEHG